MTRMTSSALPRRLSSSSRYCLMSTGFCATPVSMAACATADASQISTRGSNGFGNDVLAAELQAVDRQ